MSNSYSRVSKSDVEHVIENSGIKNPMELISLVVHYFDCSRARAEDLVSEVIPDFNIEEWEESEFNCC